MRATTVSLDAAYPIPLAQPTVIHLFFEHPIPLRPSAMYGFITIMPVTGFAMGLFNGGKGIPFFGLAVIPGFEKNGTIAGTAFKIHKKAGLAMEYFTMLHVSAVGYHIMRGHPILYRMGIGAAK